MPSPTCAKLRMLLLTRWGLADLLNRSDRTCWSSLVDWAMDRRPDSGNGSEAPWFGPTYGGDEPRRLRNTFDADRCKAERDDPRLGGCYCGKFRRSDEELRRIAAERMRGEPS